MTLSPITSARDLASHGLDDRQRLGIVGVAVRQREAGVSGRTLPRVAVEVDAALEAAGDEAAIELVVVVERVRPGPHGVGDAEVDTEAGARALHARGDSGTVENPLQVAVE